MSDLNIGDTQHRLTGIPEKTDGAGKRMEGTVGNLLLGFLRHGNLLYSAVFCLTCARLLIVQFKAIRADATRALAAIEAV